MLLCCVDFQAVKCCSVIWALGSNETVWRLWTRVYYTNRTAKRRTLARRRHDSGVPVSFLGRVRVGVISRRSAWEESEIVRDPSRREGRAFRRLFIFCCCFSWYVSFTCSLPVRQRFAQLQVRETSEAAPRSSHVNIFSSEAFCLYLSWGKKERERERVVTLCAKHSGVSLIRSTKRRARETNISLFAQFTAREKKKRM